MDFVDEEDVVVGEICEDGGEVASAFDGGAGGDAEVAAHFVGDDAGHSGFAEAGWAVEEDVIDGFGAFFSSGDGEFEVVFETVLADVFVEGLRAEGDFY